MTLDFTTPSEPGPRGDLVFLRRRCRAAAPVAGSALPNREGGAPGGASLGLDGGAPGGASLDLGGEPAAPVVAPVDLAARPVALGGVSLDLDGEPAVPVVAPVDLAARPVAFGSVSLDLGGEPAAPVRTSLDLAAPPPVPDTWPAPPARRSGRPVVRLAAGRRLQLGPKAPAITLDRLQSAIGLLTVEAVSGAAALGCAYELTDGRSAYLGSGTTASRTPFLAVRRRSVSADLRQVRQLVRLVVIAVFPPAEPSPGLLVVSTWDGGRLELPTGGSGRVTVPLSVHNVGGELVLRAEAGEALTSPRAAVEAFGFHRISWLDDFTCAGGVA